jgi:Fe-S-cluster-containing hydrogenase component 2
MNGFVVADTRRCIGCFACQAACVENHRRAGLQAYPRLIVTRTPDGSMPVQCRQCEDAPCSVVCPVKAIVCKGGSVQLNESLCIGCKMCSLACPFGVLFPGGTPIPVNGFNTGQYSYINSPYQTEPMHLREMDQGEVLSLIAWHLGQKNVMVKCDLCFFDEEGPACVRACPHKALRLIDLQTDQDASKIARMKTAADVRQAVTPQLAFTQQGED